MKEISMRDAIREALWEEMERDPNVFLIGEDIGVMGNIFGITADFIKKFGKERVRDTPLSESAIIGCAIGAAMTGMRPVAEIMYMDFIGCCFDAVCNQAAKIRFMSGGKVKVPMVIRTNCGAGFQAAAQHSQSWEAIFMHVPGIKIAIPSTPYDAKGLLKTAIRGDDPVLFLEHKMLYFTKGLVPEEEYLIPFGKADVKKEGKDITIVATLAMVQKALKAADILAKEGIEAEVIDPRTLVPFDKQTIINSVKKTGRIVIVTEENKRGASSAEIASIIAEEAWSWLKAPIKRIGAPNTPVPFSPPLENYYIPNEEKIIEAVKELING
ncbi:MAG: alpha-ketoacid dehydrogenase subunit beta [Candidatus Hadarchaeum sp.]|uniref:alpha-ketoacid dehydrogenase subunit beta n=1 Tax=Candidatus Hadarchaeum sp. TaxID=2883567 RepID=UPI0031768C41